MHLSKTTRHAHTHRYCRLKRIHERVFQHDRLHEGSVQFNYTTFSNAAYTIRQFMRTESNCQTSFVCMNFVVIRYKLTMNLKNAVLIAS